MSVPAGATRFNPGKYRLVPASSDGVSVSAKGPKDGLVLVNGDDQEEGIFDVAGHGNGYLIENTHTKAFTGKPKDSDISLPGATEDDRLYWTPDFALRRVYLAKKKVSDVQVWKLLDPAAADDDDEDEDDAPPPAPLFNPGKYHLVAAASDGVTISIRGPTDPLVLVNEKQNEGIFNVDKFGAGFSIQNAHHNRRVVKTTDSDRVALTGDEVLHDPWEIIPNGDKGFYITLPGATEDDRVYWTPDFALRRVYLAKKKVSDVQLWKFHDPSLMDEDEDEE
ncbi:hypothetical protein NP233_g8528 [Leucocoprinus birnbaumii]|uniref:Uncharacterized protein n=1 Tax=Leucocoprinus birnbaumii TaxID=56174 RepID=A0AAD5YTS3_9AGAR|nr:hypothetical protein NP233_g8528 [Leucocoprinus birnbaumii]